MSAEADRARDFARLYVALVEALRKEGVIETVAREEARLAATTAMLRADELALRPPSWPGDVRTRIGS